MVLATEVGLEVPNPGLESQAFGFIVHLCLSVSDFYLLGLADRGWLLYDCSKTLLNQI